MTLDYAIGQGWTALDAQVLLDTLNGYGVVTPTDGANLDVDPDTGLDLTVYSGSAVVGDATGGSPSTVTLGSDTTVSLSAADPDDPRKDTIYIDSGGTVQVETGTPEPAQPSGDTRFDTWQPEPPLPSTDGVVLAEVYVDAGATSLAAADVRDHRIVDPDSFDDDTQSNVSNDGSEVVASASDINFGTNLTASDDGDGTATVDADDRWALDGTQTDTGVNTSTYTISGSYDILEFHVEIDASNAGMNLRANGDTGSNYDYTDQGGTTNSNQTEIDLGSTYGEGIFVFSCQYHFGTRWIGNNDPMGFTFSAANGFSNDNITSPLTDVTIFSSDSSTFDITWQVYGKDIGPSGTP